MIHPVTTDRLRTFLVNNSITRLLLYYLLLTLVLAVGFGVILYVVDTPHQSVLDWSEYAFLGLFNALSDPPFDLNLVQRLVKSTLTFLSVMLPTLLLGTVVFKLLVKRQIITFAPKAWVFYAEKRKNFVVGVRFYSSSSLELVNIDVTVTSRLYTFYGDSNRYSRRTNKAVYQAHFPSAQQHIPHGVRCNLEDGDIDIEGKQLVAFLGNPLDHERMELVVVVTGTIPALGMDFAEMYTYHFPKDLQWGRYQTVDVFGEYAPGTTSKHWRGWENFEGSEAEFEATLPSEVDASRGDATGETEDN